MVASVLLTAATENKPQTYCSIEAVPLARIIGNENPRQEPANLAALGYELIKPNDIDHSLLYMALSNDIEQVKRFVELMEQHEGQADVEAEEDSGEQSIVGLASSLAVIQLQPVVVRKVGNSGNCMLIFGQRRVAAIAYLHAKSRLEGKRIHPAVILATETKVKDDAAFDLAVRENFDRKDFTPLQEGAVYYAYTKRINKETGKPWTLRDVARHLGHNYNTVRSRHALMLPRVEDKVGKSGEIKPGRGLTNEDRASLEKGAKTLTWATRRALGESHYSETGERQTNRARPVPLREMQRFFDETDEENEERRKAIADCMGLKYKEAAKLSEKRIQQADTVDLRRRKRRKATPHSAIGA